MAFGTAETVQFIAGWEISYETLNGQFSDRGKTIREAVDAAMKNHEAWR